MTLITRSLTLNPSISIGYRLTLNLKVFWILSFISILALLAFYVFQVNALTQEIYFSQSYEKKANQLSQENRFLEINFSRANSLKNIESYVQAQNFEKIGKVEYIRVLESTVAAKSK